VDREGEVLESFVMKPRNKAVALKFLKKAMRLHGSTNSVVTDGLRSYKTALKDIGVADKQIIGRGARAENSTCHFDDENGHAALPPNEDLAEIQRRPRCLPQSLQPRSSPHQSPSLRRPS
jgi:hypothetical protein